MPTMQSLEQEVDYVSTMKGRAGMVTKAVDAMEERMTALMDEAEAINMYVFFRLLRG